MTINKTEIKRKLFHVTSGILITFLLYFNFLDKTSMILISVIALLISFIVKFIKIQIVQWFLKHFDRKQDINTFPGKGAVLFVLGSTLSVLLFNKNIAIASILILSFGDAVSSLFGLHFGTVKNPFNERKFIEGSMAAVVISSLVASLFVNFFAAFLASVAAMFIESLGINFSKKYYLNDNLTIPLVSGLVISIINLL